MAVDIIASCLEFLMLLDHSDLLRMLYINLEFDLAGRQIKGHGGSGFGKSEPSTYACSFYAPSSSSRPPIIHFHFDVNGKQSPFPTKRSAKRCIIFYKGVSFECLSYCGRD